MTVSTASLALTLETLDSEEEASTICSTDEEKAVRRRSLLNAKIDKSIKTTAQIKERRRSSIEEGSNRLSTDSIHSDPDSASRKSAREQRKRASGLSVSVHSAVSNEQKKNTASLSATCHGPAPPTPINRNSDLDLDPLQKADLNPLKAVDSRRRRLSANDEPSAETKRRARLLVNQNRRRRAASFMVSSKRTLSDDSNPFGINDESIEPKASIKRCSSTKRLSSGSDSSSIARIQRSGSKKRLSSGSDSSGIARIQRRDSRRTLSNDSDSVGLQKQSSDPKAKVQRSSVRRRSSVEQEPSGAESGGKLSSSNVRRQKVVSSQVLSELGVGRRDSGSKAQSAANRRRASALSKSFRLSGNLNETWDSPPDKKNFTWSWKKDETESASTLRRTNRSFCVSNTSSSPKKNTVSSLLREDPFISPPSAKITKRLSVPSDMSRANHPMVIAKISQRQRQKKISPKRTSKCADLLLSPAARRTSRTKAPIGSISANTQSYPNLPLLSPDSKTKSNWKKSRGSSVRRQVAKSKSIVLEPNCLEFSGREDVVNKKDIGAIAKALKQSNQAEEDLERQKEEERHAKRSHVRARRRQFSIEPNDMSRAS